MIIFHNPEDKDSRNFVEKYGQGHTVMLMNDPRRYAYPISAFPSVLADVPEHVRPAHFGPDGEAIPEQTIPAHQIVIRLPASMDAVYAELSRYQSGSTS